MFDFVGTLATLEPSREKILADLLSEVDEGTFIPQNILRRAFLSADVEMPYSSLTITNALQRYEFYSSYNEIVLKHLEIPNLLSGSAIHEFFLGKPKRWELVEGALSTLNHFRSLGYRLAVLSNFDKGLESLSLGSYELGELVDDVVTSGEMGIEKPDIEFFRSYLRNFDFETQSSFYVGDSYELDYLPAREIGLRVFLVDPLGVFGHLPGAIPRLQDTVGKIR
jgi:HAD superfamily hydrolase (TIGR01549 family)